MTMRRFQSGFTLIEIVIVVAVIGVISLILAPLYEGYSTSQRRAYDERQNLINMSIAKALMSHAGASTTQGRLPAPYTGGGLVSTVADPADVALNTTLTEAGLDSSEVNTDGTVAQKVRVYQRANGITANIPLYFQSGPLTTLYFDYGAVYMTDCIRADGSCNPSGTGIPGSSPVLTSANYATWVTAGTDGKGVIISTLPLQKSMLALTVSRLDKVRDAMLSYLRTQQITAAAGDGTNWFPPNPGTLGGQDPVTNQGCRDGWYNLADASSTILSTVGLSKEEFGVTAWGGRIEYCRDYDPTAAGAPNAAPHYGALRINKTPSTGAAANVPDGAVIGNNIILTF